MTREQIEKAAKETLVNEPVELQATKVGAFQHGFVAGAEWRISSVWHDAHEEPQHSGRLIASNKDGNYILCGPNNCNWKQTVKLFHIINWAYIIDLLPERKEESK